MHIAIAISHDKYFWHKSIADILTLRPVWNLINLVQTWPGKTHVITAPYITDNCWKLLVLQTSQQLISTSSTSLLDYKIPTEQTFEGNLVKNVLDEHWGWEFKIEQLLTAIERQLGAVLVLSLISTESRPLIHLWLLQWPLTTSTTRATGLHDMDGSQCTTGSTPTIRHKCECNELDIKCWTITTGSTSLLLLC